MLVAVDSFFPSLPVFHVLHYRRLLRNWQLIPIIINNKPSSGHHTDNARTDLVYVDRLTTTIVSIHTQSKCTPSLLAASIITCRIAARHEQPKWGLHFFELLFLAFRSLYPICNFNLVVSSRGVLKLVESFGLYRSLRVFKWTHQRQKSIEPTICDS